jgi:hypothetical protein
LVGIERTEAIDESGGEEAREFGPFFGGEARVMDVFFRILDIDFFVSDVEVAGQNDRFFSYRVLS